MPTQPDFRTDDGTIQLARMDKDGNLVLYGADGKPVTLTGTLLTDFAEWVAALYPPES